MVCMYTAQGEFLCRPNVEHYENSNPTVNCYGINVNSSSDCDTCGKVKNVLTTANKPFNAKNISQCSAPGGTWKNLMKNNTVSCRSAVVDKLGYMNAQCKKDDLSWANAKTGVDLITCASGKLENANGVLQCMK